MKLCFANLSSAGQVGALTAQDYQTPTPMNKSHSDHIAVVAPEASPKQAYIPSDTTPIRNTFERIRSQMAQEAEQKSRPVSRLYPGLRALRA